MSAPEMPDLDNMTKTELIQYGETHGINGLNDRMTKADIIAAIEGAIS